MEKCPVWLYKSCWDSSWVEKVHVKEIAEKKRQAREEKREAKRKREEEHAEEKKRKKTRTQPPPSIGFQEFCRKQGIDLTSEQGPLSFQEQTDVARMYVANVRNERGSEDVPEPGNCFCDKAFALRVCHTGPNRGRAYTTCSENACGYYKWEEAKVDYKQQCEDLKKKLEELQGFLTSDAPTTL